MHTFILLPPLTLGLNTAKSIYFGRRPQPMYPKRSHLAFLFRCLQTQQMAALKNLGSQYSVAQRRSRSCRQLSIRCFAIGCFSDALLPEREGRDKHQRPEQLSYVNTRFGHIVGGNNSAAANNTNNKIESSRFKTADGFFAGR